MLNQAWARWLLFAFNVLLAFLTSLAVGYEHGSSVQALPYLLALALPPVLFAVLARLNLQRRGVLFQTMIATIELLLSLIGDAPSLAVYGAYALLAVWLLGDFGHVTPATPRLRVSGTPDIIARTMFERGAGLEALRAALATRKMPADEIEAHVYALAAAGRD